MSKLLRALMIATAWLLGATAGMDSAAAAPPVLADTAYPQTTQRDGPLLLGAASASWQGPVQAWSDETLPNQAAPIVEPVPPERLAPLLDDCNTDVHDVVIGQELAEDIEDGAAVRRGVRPYGGGHPWDWPWGCGASPYRTGPGLCDNFRVGPIWNVSVDGMVLRRESTDLSRIWNETDDGQGIPELFEQFDYASGGRVSIVGKYPRCVGYRVQAAFEGIEKWEASIIYPKQQLDNFFIFPDLGEEIVEDTQVLGASEQRRVHYTSNLYSGELNIIKCQDNPWQPYCGVRYMKFDDELRIFDDQEAQGPLAVLNPPAMTPIEILTTDMTNLFDLENNLMGFQIGLRHDFWPITRRFGFEGFLNAGLYYNKVKYTNFMNTTTTQRIGTITSVDIEDTINFTGDSNVVSATNLATSDLSEIAYSYEASLSGVFRINRCWQVRAGYQVLWINGLRLADQGLLNSDTFLGNGTRDLLFQGWHAGIECRR